MQGFGHGLTVVSLGVLLGGMVFFAAITAPTVFARLPPETAGPFIRALFPRYYGFIVAMSALAAIGLMLRGTMVTALVAVAIAAATLFLWLDWMPHLNALRDAGDQAGFARGHRLSVWVNGVEMVVAFWVLVGVI